MQIKRLCSNFKFLNGSAGLKKSPGTWTFQAKCHQTGCRTVFRRCYMCRRSLDRFIGVRGVCGLRANANLRVSAIHLKLCYKTHGALDIIPVILPACHTAMQINSPAFRDATLARVARIDVCTSQRVCLILDPSVVVLGSCRGECLVCKDVENSKFERIGV